MTTLRMMAIDAICQRGSIRDSDVATLRRAFALETQISASDIDALFRAQNLARVSDPSWSDFFIETLTDYVVRELEPAGYVTAAHAGWLIARVSSAGRIRSKTEHDLLLNVIDKSRWVPESLMTFALSQIRDAVTTGEGPLRAGTGLGAGAISLAEVEQLRALLFAYGNEGPKSITGAEIELLLDIDAAIAARQDRAHAETATSQLEAWPLESWRDLITKASASAVLSASGYSGPSREEALSETRPLLEDGCQSCRPGRPIREGRSSITCFSTAPLAASYRPLAQEAKALLRLELQRIEIITGEPVRTADPVRLAELLCAPRLSEGAAGQIAAMLEAAGFELAPALTGRTTRHTVHAA